MVPQAAPVLIFDGDCGFCTRCADWLRRHLAAGVSVADWQHTDLETLGVTTERARHEAIWVDLAPPGARQVRGGARAIAAALAHCDSPAWRAVGRALGVWPVRWLAAPVYRLVARYRHRLPGGSPACAMNPGQRAVGD